MQTPTGFCSEEKELKTILPNVIKYYFVRALKERWKNILTFSYSLFFLISMINEKSWHQQKLLTERLHIIYVIHLFSVNNTWIGEKCQRKSFFYRKKVKLFLTEKVHGDNSSVSFSVILDLVRSVEVSDAGGSRLQTRWRRMMVHACNVLKQIIFIRFLWTCQKPKTFFEISFWAQIKLKFTLCKNEKY